MAEEQPVRKASETVEDCCADCYVRPPEHPLLDYLCEGFPVRLCEKCRCPECIPVESLNG